MTSSGNGGTGVTDRGHVAIMDHDPGVQAGILSYGTHPVRGFPGAALPA